MPLDRLRPGDLRDQITIQRPKYSSDGGGGRALTGWELVAQTWAEIEPINGGEAFRAGLAAATQFYRLRFRFRSDVTPSCRLLLADGTALNIRTCGDPNREREQLLITAESGVADG